ncbi:MAG: IS66 family insertion sequence element accessory protein TnpB, partial [Planctomycetaceae bacterium]|nr:IS66 family insertion sequence element accessory protein TnpB [Planctomycetaceae bacterium]
MMRPSPKTAPVYLCAQPVDFRKSINGLSAMVELEFDLDPFAEALFVFCNRQRDKVKILYWEKNGFCLWYKRLEKDRFKWPKELERYGHTGRNGVTHKVASTQFAAFRVPGN